MTERPDEDDKAPEPVPERSLPADAPEAHGDPADSMHGIVRICLVAIVAGAAIGLVGGGFRWCLEYADKARVDIVDWAHTLPGPGWLVTMAGVALCAALAAQIVRWVPLAAGSGIPHVEAVYAGHARLPLLLLLPAKFIGGVLSIGSGLVLGREGPTVHMGAVIGAEAAKRAKLEDADCRMMQTSVGGAGLAVAFNAPIAGALFVMEEVTRTFKLRAVLPTLLGAAVAVACGRFILGNEPDFDVEPIGSPELAWLPLFVVFGLFTGLLGWIYNHMVLFFLDHVTAESRVPAVVKAAGIGAVIGLIMFIEPQAVGGGDALTQPILSGQQFVIPVIIGFLVVRLFLGSLSYSANVPGGLFAPLLALGALWGLLFVNLLDAVWPGHSAELAVPMALVGMASFFGATVRAPLTGIVVVMEMTATTAVAIAMLAATAASVLVAELTKLPPLYESLRERMAPETKH